jgi:probable rRNA maturation factor
MRVEVSVQYAAPRTGLPSKTAIARWARAALKGMRRAGVSVNVRIVERKESAALNERFRRKPGATNVLAFPFEAPPGTRSDLLGDVVICADIVKHEARARHAPGRAHWAHMVVHGIMHLRGYDHRNRKDAEAMERKESRILEGLGFADPYS